MDTHHLHAIWHAKQLQLEQLREQAKAGDIDAAIQLKKREESTGAVVTGMVGTGLGLAALGFATPVAAPIILIVGMFIEATKMSK